MAIWFEIREIRDGFMTGYNPGVGEHEIILGDEFDEYDRGEDWNRREELERWGWGLCSLKPGPTQVWVLKDGSKEKPDGVMF